LSCAGWQAELEDAADWYENRQPGRGAAFAASVGQLLLDIENHPDAHPEVYGDVREALVPGYPYAVYYRVDPTQITVLAVFHTSRDPADWQRRA
jgi:toxin ParE1/3/4